MKHSAPPAKPKALVAVLTIVLAGFAAACSKATQNRVQIDLAGSNPARANSININTAPAQELETLPGIGKAIAERIIAHRELYGPFRRTEHLLMVRGISDSRFRALRPMITVDGRGEARELHP